MSAFYFNFLIQISLMIQTTYRFLRDLHVHATLACGVVGTLLIFFIQAVLIDIFWCHFCGRIGFI